MIEAIVLAAGLATRMGGIKPLASIDGVPSLERILQRIAAVGIVRPIVVLGSPSARRIEATVHLDSTHVIINHAPAEGMSRSLRLGLEAVSEPAVGVLVFHADMPYIALDTILAVLRAADSGAMIAAPVYRETRGFPVFFHRACLANVIGTLSGDTGGQTYIEAHLKNLVPVAVADPGCIHDIDRPADIAAWEGGHRCVIDA